MRWLVGRVAETIPETPVAVTVQLDLPDWPGHRAGQHVDVRLTAEDGYSAQRSYSIASTPDAEPLALPIARIDDGEVSPYLTTVLDVGDELELRGPIGGYFGWEPVDTRPVLLAGGGSGVVPLMAMLRHHAACGSQAAMHLVYSARTVDDVLYRDELETLEPRDGLRVKRTYTREPPAGWTGWSRRVDAEMLAAITPGPAPRCFVCGPTLFVEVVNDLLVAAGHDPRRVHGERFGPTGG